MQRFWPYPLEVFLCGRHGYELPFSYIYIQFVFRKLQMSALAHFLISSAKNKMTQLITPVPGIMPLVQTDSDKKAAVKQHNKTQRLAEML
jgi:hypothetical protein